ncbi:MAG TPA: secretin and TonB N-terminal domain-containing protein [Pirellulales bacterium]|nr:secretin and TonB N-terminal domain-containing protein [Pirellulales bacterium]
MNKLLRGSLLFGCVALGGGAAVFLAAAQPKSVVRTPSKSRVKLNGASAASPSTNSRRAARKVELSDQPAPRDAAPPQLVAAARIEPLRQAYAPPHAQEVIAGAVAPADPARQTGVSTEALLKVLEKFTEVAKSRPEADKAAAPQAALKNLLGAENSNDADSAPDDARAPMPEDLADPSQNAEDLPPPSRRPAPRKSQAEGEASITHLPGYSEGDEHLEIHIQDEELRKVLALLSEQGGMNILAGPSVQGTVSASLNDVSVDAALDAILKSTGYVAQRSGKFIYVGTNEDFELMKQSADRIGVRVYRPNYVAAKDMASLLTPLLSAAPVGKISLNAPAEVGIAPSGTTSGGNGMAESEALVVQDYEAVLREIDQVVKEIDKRPSQVCIETMILSVQLNDQNQIGIDFQALRNQQNLRFGLGTPRTAPLDGSGNVDANGNTIGAFSFANGGMNLAFLDGSLGAFFAFLETVGDTNVIATPKVLCLNKQRAEIQIGEQLGYVTTTLTSTSTAQTINFLDTGAQLRLRPFISDDGMIRLEVHPELSTGTVDQKGNFTLPNKQVTQVTTNIMVRDGCTVVIGGLMREDLQTQITQIPVMGSLPVVGPLFRHKTETMTRREILVVLTPRLVREPESTLQAERGADEFILRQNVYRDHMSPVAKRYLGRKAFRKAQAALAAGDRATAMRLSDRAVFYDHENQQAIEFREQVHGRAQPTPAAPIPPGPMDQPLDGEEIAPWVLDGLGGGPMLPPRDEGQTGKILQLERADIFDETK